MRLFYLDEGPIDTLLQIAERPIADGDLVSKRARDTFEQLDLVARCHGWNVITAEGRKIIGALAIRRTGLPVANVNQDSAWSGPASPENFNAELGRPRSFKRRHEEWT